MRKLFLFIFAFSTLCTLYAHARSGEYTVYLFSEGNEWLLEQPQPNAVGFSRATGSVFRSNCSWKAKPGYTLSTMVSSIPMTNGEYRAVASLVSADSSVWTWRARPAFGPYPDGTTTTNYWKVEPPKYIRIEDTEWSRQSTKPAGTYYNVGTGIWTRCFWTSQTEAFGGCTLNGVAVSPVTDNWYFIAAPTTTNLYFRAVKASYSVTLAESSDCCVFSPTNGTYTTGSSFTFTVKPKDGYGVLLRTNSVTIATVTKEQTFTFPIKANTTFTAAPKTITYICNGGSFAGFPFDQNAYTNTLSQPLEFPVTAVPGCALYKLTDNGKEVSFAGDSYWVDTKQNHTLELTPVTISVAPNPVGTTSPAVGVYTNGVDSFTYSITNTNTAYTVEGVYMDSEKLTAAGGVYTVEPTKPSTIWVKVNKFPPSPAVGGVVASVSFTASGSWQFVNITSPADFDPTTGQKLLPHYGDAVMIQALGGDIDIAQSTNFTSTIYTKTAPYQLELSPITIPDGNTLVINKPLPGIWFKGSGNVTISTVQR